jgi:hypothetical protein
MKMAPWLYWLPRLLSFVWIGFFSLFALDAFDAQDTVFENIGHFATHLVLPALLSLVLLLAWFRPSVGGLLMLLSTLAMSVLIYRLNWGMNHHAGKSPGIVALLCGPFLLSALLFLTEGKRSKKV